MILRLSKCSQTLNSTARLECTVHAGSKDQTPKKIILLPNWDATDACRNTFTNISVI